LQESLRQHSARNYSIYFDRETDKLFAYVEIESEELWAKIAQTEVCRRWWAHMRDLMRINDDDSPVAINLEEVFHMN
jgi:L-rhamnose mutarotase